jgi:hypothetical protein
MKPSRDEQGAVLLLVLAGCLVMLLFAGLVYDGGRVLVARRDGVGVAAEAARAGAQSLATGSLTGAVRLDPAAAVVAADRQLARAGWTGSATVEGTTVRVSVHRQVVMTFWVMLGFNHLDASATASAQAVAGVRGANR